MTKSKIKWTTEQRRINDLVPLPNNPRQISERQANELKRSIEKFDLVEIPAINFDNTIIAGHQRLKIMQMLGRGNEIIDVRVPNGILSAKEVKEYNIRSNKNTGMFNYEILANEFEADDLIDWGFSTDELTSAGFDTDDGGGDGGSESLIFKIKCDGVREMKKVQKFFDVDQKSIEAESFLELVKDFK